MEHRLSPSWKLRLRVVSPPRGGRHCNLDSLPLHADPHSDLSACDPRPWAWCLQIPVPVGSGIDGRIDSIVYRGQHVFRQQHLSVLSCGTSLACQWTAISACMLLEACSLGSQGFCE